MNMKERGRKMTCVCFAATNLSLNKKKYSSEGEEEEEEEEEEARAREGGAFFTGGVEGEEEPS